MYTKNSYTKIFEMKNEVYPYSVRAKLGVSMSEFGDLIEVSKSQLFMVEAGSRLLSRSALDWLYVVEKALANADTSTENLWANTDALQKLKEAQLKKLNVQRNNILQKLEALEKEAEQNLFFLRAASVRQTLPMPTKSEFPLRRMEILERNNNQQYKKKFLQIQDLKVSLAG
jgi:transcriptional regulator with XRE-family HTH domain